MVETVELLGIPGELKFTQDAEGLKIRLPHGNRAT
jgi:hypothetical protein